MSNAARTRQRARANRRAGRPTNAEINMIDAVAADLVRTKASDEQLVEQVEATAVALRRDPKVIRERIEAARDKFLGRAERLTDILYEATELALEQRDPEIAGKLALQQLERIKHSDDKGTVRVIEPEAKGDGSGSGVRVNIILPQQLGGVRQPPVIEASAQPALIGQVINQEPVE